MLSLIVAILVIIVLVVISVFFAKQFFKLIAGLWSVLFIIVIVLGVFLYFDIKDLHAKFDSSEKVILLEDNGNILTGFMLNKDNKETTFYKDMSEVNNAFKVKNYAKMKGEAYKLLIAKKSLFNDVELIDVIGYPVERETLFAYLYDQTPRSKAAEYISKENSIPKALVIREMDKNFASEDQFKGYLFAKLIGKVFEDKGADFIIIAYKKGDLEVYPETISFKMIELLPQVIFEKLFGEEEQ